MDSSFRLQLLSGRRLICVRGRAETSGLTTPPTSLLEETSNSVSAVREGSAWTRETESQDDCRLHTHTHTVDSPVYHYRGLYMDPHFL